MAKSTESLGERARAWSDAARSNFGFLSAVGIVLAVVLGFTVTVLDDLLEIDVPVFTFESLENARAVLTTIATATVSVAGLAFSVTVVAFTLASSQLSPRVLRSFRTDRLSQATLAVLLATFVFCVVVLVRLDATADPDGVSNLSITVALILALVALGMFAAFISHIVEMLQPSSVVTLIRKEASGNIDHRYPRRSGDEPDDPDAAAAAASGLMAIRPGVPVRAEDGGYLVLVHTGRVLRLLDEEDGFVRQIAVVGDYVLPGDVLAEVWAREDPQELVDDVRQGFELGPERTVVQDLAFSVRQLADIALKGLSSGLNDPTTATNALWAIGDLLVRIARSDDVSMLRMTEGRPRLLLRAPTLDELVELGFNQPRIAATEHPAVEIQILEILERISAASATQGAPSQEALRQQLLIRRGAAAGDLPTEVDAASVRHWSPTQG